MKEVENIDLPTLIICGEEDELTPVKYSQYLHSRIRGVKIRGSSKSRAHGYDGISRDLQ